MELKDLLGKQSWDQGSLDIKEAFKDKGYTALKRLGRYYYQSLAINTVFLAGTIGLYLYYQTVEMLSSSALMGLCFLLVLIKSYQLVKGYRSIDLSQNIVAVIQESLSLEQNTSHSIRRMASMIFTCSFLGGFFAGLFVRGWTFQKITEKPVILIIASVLAVGVYYLSKSSGMKKYSKKVNPGYYQTKHELQAILEDLRNEE